MAVDQVDNYYYTPAQSTADYSRPDEVRDADRNAAASQTQSVGQTQPPADQTVKVYFYDDSTGQNVNLLV